jgi:trigger factor
LQGGQAENFELTLGESQSLEALEELVKTLTPGQSTDQEITFPSDFLNQGLSEVSVDMHVQLKGIKTRVLPEVDDDLAQRAGGFKDVKEMRQAIRDSYEKGREQVARSETQRQLLDELLAKVDFPLPESMVENQIQGQVQKTRRQLESQGQSLESAGKSEADIRKASRPEAENTVKSYLFLLAIAHKEGVTVSGQDLERHLHRLAGETGQDVESLKEYYKKNDLIHALIDQLRADKAMDLIYEHAQIEEVTPGQDPKDLDQAQPAADSGQ